MSKDLKRFSSVEPKQVFAVFAVAMLLCVSLTMLNITREADAPGDYTQTVTYHPDSSDEGVVINYDGVASAEYNPVYWDSDNGEENWDAPTGTVEIPVSISVSVSLRGAQTGETVIPSAYSNLDLDYSGLNGNVSLKEQSDGSHKLVVESNWEGCYGTIAVNCNYSATVEKVFGGWSTDPLNNDVGEYYPGSILDGVADLYAVWLFPVLYYEDVSCEIGAALESPNVLTLLDYGDSWSGRRYAPSGENEYTIIYNVSREIGINGSISTGTYRSESENGSFRLSTAGYWFSSYPSLNGNVIIDNLRVFYNSTPGNNHGDGVEGLYANGHRLIMGPDVTTCGSAGWGQNSANYLQVFGGTYSGSVDSTDVVIFSGIYYNVVAGSHGSGVIRDTHLVIRGGFILDTVLGGSSGNGTVNGSTWVYMLGNVIMPGDYYEEEYLEGTTNVFDTSSGSIPRIKESTILTGGSNDGLVAKDTHVFLSNNAQLWDVQAGGRRASSTVGGTAMAEVSGNAVIKHVLCGSITDGNNTNTNTQSVKNTSLTVTDNAMVGSVFGAGYDTYYLANSASMYGDSTISVTISGGTVGSVYGGGYRGTVGTESSPLASISITINGGTVLNDVFGGGRGGLDKMLHNDDGGCSDVSNNHYQSLSDTTGKSSVYADRISITVSGGTVYGNVFGGGESVPLISEYNGLSRLSGSTYLGDSKRAEVASVICPDVRVTVSGGTVCGSVYGAGKGVDVSDTVDVGGTTYHNTAFIFAIREGNLVRIPWVSGTSGTEQVETVRDSDVYDDFAHLDGNVRIYISGGTVCGSVYGAGKGVSVQTDENRSIARMSGESISIDISNGTVNGSVFGGGEYGVVYNDDTTRPTVVTIDLGETRIEGNVHLGGLGEEGRLSMYSGTRTLTIDGASISGSVYGGSRLGNDNMVTTSDTNSYLSVKAASHILFVSGDILSGSSGNIYGGGYMGQSYMDVTILIGHPAMEEANLEKPAVDYMRVRSVIGGSSVGLVDPENSGGFSTVLLYGNTAIVVGLSEGMYSDWGISGDVLGKGDYCDIAGTSTVTFTDYSQSGQLLSIQKTDHLTLERSELTISGNVDAESSSGTMRLSLNRIGMLTMSGTSGGGSRMVLNAAAASISGYESVYSTAEPDDIGKYNCIRLNSGLMFSVLGDDNKLNEVSGISGKTLLESDRDSYYGAFVIGGPVGVINDSTGFWVAIEDDGGTNYVETQTVDYGYGGGTVRVWYIQGSFKLESTMILTDTGSNPVEGSIEVTMPKMNSGSSIGYAGYYINPYTPGSMVLVEGTPAVGELGVTLGRGESESGYSLFGTTSDNVNYDGLRLYDGTRYEIVTASESAPLLEVEFTKASGFETTGYIGSITIHMVEMVGTVAVNVFDVEVGVYLRVGGQELAGQTIEIDHDIAMYEGGDEWTGEVDIYLPFLPGNGIGTYTLTGVSGVDGQLLLSTVSTNVGKSGWDSCNYTDRPLNVSDTTTVLGEGGVFSPVIHLDYTTESSPYGKPIVLNVQIQGSDGTIVVKITVMPVDPGTVTVTIYDQDFIEADGKFAWSDPYKLFDLDIVYGDRLSDIWVAYLNSFGEWRHTSDSETIEDGFLHLHLFGNSGIYKGYSEEMVRDEISELENADSYTVSTLENLLDQIVSSKQSVTVSAGDQKVEFVYSSSYGWYSSRGAVNEYNFSSQTSEDVNIYASYSVEVKFIAVDESGSIDSYLTVRPDVMLPGIPGSEVNLEQIVPALRVTPGYEITKITDGTDSTATVYYPVDKGASSSFDCYNDVTLYVFLKRIPFELGVSVDRYVNGESVGSLSTVSFEVTVDDTVVSLVGGYYSFYYGSRVEISFTLPTGYSDYHVFGLSDSNLAGTSFSVDDVGEWTVSFDGPQRDLRDLKIHIRSEYEVTLNLVEHSNNDNGLFSLSGNTKFIIEGDQKTGDFFDERRSSESDDVRTLVPG